MPAKVGVVKVISLSSSSIFNIGDVYYMAPQAAAKTFAGGGSFNTGDGIRININRSETFVNDSENIDQPIVGNA
ncbi:spore germination protein [Halobacillus kuroshimensis]|uniref:Spore germination protein n=1 Tax=Halobacillus kuroshimensis TaxID=302481 RepID=A0ABS3DQR5_9BACI|nr:spore germination protein [Halobacillus kuroshimensis]MBN8233681.1 spore germination protein [Halobacillus kuroshimensis]